MTDVLSTALSGLRAQQLRVSTAAGNIAAAPASLPGPEGAAAVYKPLSVQLLPQAGGGVSAAIVAGEGEVDFAAEAITLLEAKAAYKANLAVLKTQDEMTRDMLDTLT